MRSSTLVHLMRHAIKRSSVVISGYSKCSRTQLASHLLELSTVATCLLAHGGLVGQSQL